MTEQTTEALIAEARDIWEADDLYPDQMIPRLVKALEAAEQRAAEYAAVVEKVRAARTPSDDEREELANLIPLGFREQDGVRNVYDAADRILTAGFRKADREPSDAAVEAAARAMAHADVTNPDGWVMSEEARNVYRDMARAALIAAQEVRDES